jgi:hypothetical protein
VILGANAAVSAEHWVDQSKIKRTIQKYNDKLDDFDLL